MAIVTRLAAPLLLTWSMFALQQAQALTDVNPPATVFRDPFTLKLHIDKDHFYEEKFEKVPYVSGNDVYLVSGDNFGVKVTIINDEISQVTYERTSSAADIAFKFTQEDMGGRFMMVLVTQNRIKRDLFLDALMTVPNKKGVYKTSLVPVRKGLMSYETWPHPIIQLMLKNFRFSPQPSIAPKDNMPPHPAPAI